MPVNNKTSIKIEGIEKLTRKLKDLEKKYKKRGWTIVGVGSGGLLLFAGTLYVTLGPHTRN